MSWDPVWDEVFAERDLRRYPSEDLIRFVARHFYGSPSRGDVRILEVGCGTGAHVWYLACEGFDAYGIDGSANGIERARARLEADGLRGDVRVGDILDIVGVYGAGAFDAVLDVGGLQSNRLADVERMVEAVTAVLRPGGRVFADLIATGSSGEGEGREVEPGTFESVAGGLLEGKGLQHFFTRAEIERLFAHFDELEVNEWSRTTDHGRQVYRHWIVQGRLPG